MHPLCDFWNPATHWQSFDHSDYGLVIDFIHPLYFLSPCNPLTPFKNSDDFYIIAFISQMISVILQPIDP